MPSEKVDESQDENDVAIANSASEYHTPKVSKRRPTNKSAPKKRKPSKLEQEEKRRKNKEKVQRHRAKLTPEQKQNVQAKDQKYRETKRNLQTELDKAHENAQAMKRMQRHREQQSESERARDNALAMDRMQTHREQQSESERARDNANTASRMREYRANLTARARLLPVGLQCNMDIFDPSSVKYFNVGVTIGGIQYALKDALYDERNNPRTYKSGRIEYYYVPQCFHCQAIGYAKENKGPQPRVVPNGLPKCHFGSMCCNKGKISLPPFPPLPPTLLSLYTEETIEAKHFRKHIRLFNCGMAMASCTYNDKSVHGGGPAAIKICGEVHRRIGSLQGPANSLTPSMIQIYFHDANFQADYRAKRNANESTSQQEINMNREIFRKLHCMLTEECNNPYIASFLTIGEFCRSQNLDPQEIEYELHATERPPQGHHPGRYHLPTAPEVSCLMPTSIEANANRMIVSNPRDAVRSTVRQASGGLNNLSFFSCTHRSYPPLAYPCLFPYGTDGWHTNIYTTPNTEEDTRRKIQLSPFVRYHWAMRSTSLNYFHLAGRLFQQNIVDEWARVELYRLMWIRHHQDTLRADLYRGVEDSVQNQAVENSGRMTILPSSVTGSDRWYHKCYQNAMALVRLYGKPTFFITLTMDIHCPEVKVELKPGQTPYDRPDLLCRIFNMKRDEMLEDIVKNGVLGPCIAHVSVIEFQKRGAPHSHTLVWIKDFECTPHNIDNVISAEIPPAGEPGSEERKFHELVMSKMIHGPCGRSYNMNLGCVKGTNGICSRKYPRELSPRTELGDNTFPNYRRRAPEDGGNVGRKYCRGTMIDIDNRWVVPYNPYLLKKFGAHCNVEFCHAVKAVKYLFLYHFKGEDMITLEERDEMDEVKKYYTRRYISACLAYWRLAEFNIVQIQPSVTMLPVHLPAEQTVTYEPNQVAAEEALAANSVTQLVAYFNASRDLELGELARDTLYEDFPSKFVWKTDGGVKRWEKRERGSGCEAGRMPTVHASSGDLFYLRLLLKNKKGATSFEDLRSIRDEETGEVIRVCPTFKAMCVALNLCEDDKQWEDTLEEAILIRRPRAIRDLFTNICLNCNPTDPRALFEKYKEHMQDDFLLKRQEAVTQSEEEHKRLAHNDLLRALNCNFQDHDKTNATFDIDMPEDIGQQEVVLDTSEIDPNAERYYNDNYEKMNDEQTKIFEQIQSCVEKDLGGLFNIDAPGGSGKTFLSNIILSCVRKDLQIAISSALSGIAATMMKLGTTFHRRFGVPIPCHRDSTSKIRLNSKEALAIKNARVIIIDEVSMMEYRLLELLDRFLKELMGRGDFMGGKVVVLLHDFRQILPVVPGGGRTAITSASVINSYLWKHFKTLKLTKNMRVERMIRMNVDEQRVQKLKDYAKWLLQIGEGTVDTVCSGIIEVPGQMVCNGKYELEQKVYENFLQNYNNPDYLLKRAIMSSTNDTINQCNYDMIERLPGEAVISKSIDTCVEEKDRGTYDPEFLNKINASGIAPHKLILKKGACIILIKNLNVRDGHCNGTRYIVEEVTQRIIRARKLSGGPNAEILIPRIPMISKDTDFPVPFKRLQFPVLGAYYLTFNRAQGQSLDKAGLYLPQSVFSHGHLYVGFSRCGDPDNVFVYADQKEFENVKHLLEEGKTYTRNIVYKEVLT